MVAAREVLLGPHGEPPSSAPVTFEWEDVHMSIIVGRGETKQVLAGAFGRACAGEVTAILGPSGGGKTSLLNVLAGRVPTSGRPQVTGRLALDVGGKRVSAEAVDMAEISAYVEQDDVLYAFSTVRETLTMSARLRLPHFSAAQQAARVQHIIELLGLVPAADTIIGSDLPGQRGVSGGERKRVALGVELLHAPRIIFADEPTSGLDAFQALSVMTALKALAAEGCTVVATIHQPRSSIVDSFDRLVLMAQGKPAYSGPAGPPCDVFFTGLGYPVPVGYNRADHYIDLISIDYRSDVDLQESEQRLALIVAKCEQMRGSSDAEQRPMLDDAACVTAQIERRHATPAFVAFKLLMVRAFREIWRDKLTLSMKIVFGLLFGLIFGSVYWQMPADQVSLGNRTGILFFMSMNGAFGGTISIAQVIPRQLRVVTRDRANKLYGVLPFYSAQFLASLPFEILPHILNGMIVYYMANLRNGVGHFALFVLILFAENLVGAAMGMCLSASFRSPEMVPQIAPLFVILFLTFSGYFLKINSIPFLFRWISDISFIRFTFQGLAVNEFKGANDFSGPPLQPGAPLMQGDVWLEQLGFNQVSVYGNLLKLVVEMVAFHALALLILLWKRPCFVRCQAPPSVAPPELGA